MGAAYDVLTVNNNGLLHLEAEDSGGGLLPGPDIDLVVEVEVVRKLLVGDKKAPDGARAVATGGPAGGGRRPAPADPLPLTYGHSRERAHQIEYDNSRMAARLAGVAAARPKAQAASAAHDRHMANVAASGQACRRADEERVLQENLALYRRLQAVRPSRDVDAAHLGADFRRSRGYLANLRAVAGGAAPRPPLGLRGGNEPWDERWQARPSTC